MRARPLAPLTALLLAAALSVPAAASAQDVTPAATPTTDLAPAAAPGAARVVTLVTGDRVRLSTGPTGEPSVTVLSPGDGTTGGATDSAGSDSAGSDSAGSDSGFVTLRAGGHVYVVPHEAAPYLNQPLDPGLFDVTELASKGYGVGGTPLPVTITAAPGAPTRTVTGLGATGTTARVTGEGATAFGAALRAQARSDHAAGEASGAMFAGVRRIAVDGAATTGTDSDTGTDTTADSPLSTPAAGPSGDPAALHTLKVKGFDRRGNKDFGDLVVAFNVDDGDLYIAGQAFFRGEAAFSVPAGHYQVSSYITTSYSVDSRDFSLVAAPELTVTGPTSVVLDARKATRLAARTPDPTRQLLASIELDRTSASGIWFGHGFVTGDSATMYAMPTTEDVTVGTLGFVPLLQLGDADGGTGSYVYDLVFPSAGHIRDDLAQTVTRDQLVTVHTRYPSFVPGRVETSFRQALLPWGQATDAMGWVVTAPTERTEYVNALPGALWFANVDLDDAGNPVTMVDRIRTFQPGDERTETWFGPALHSGVQQEDVDVSQFCPACRQDGLLTLALAPWADGTPGHISPGNQPGSASVDVYENDALAGHLDLGIGAVKLSAEPADYRVVLDAARQDQWWQTSTATHTEWSYRSGPRGDGAGDAVPSSWVCGKTGDGGGRGLTADADGGRGGGGDGGGSTGPCYAEPLLLLDYDLPTDLAERLPADSATSLGIRVRHQRFAKDSPIATVSAEVSFDDGASWSPAEVTPSGTDGTYRAAFTTPSDGTGTGYVSLRVRATDADGNAVDQRVTRAAALPWAQPSDGGPTPPPPPPPPGRGEGIVPACGEPAVATEARCFALVNTTAGTDGAGIAADEPAGYGPADLRDAYDLPATGGEGHTIAIIDAFDNPNAEADLAAYRAHYGLPSCTTDNGCFRKVNQRGDAEPLPQAESGWGLEISLDLDMASAVCPQCNLLLVEADTPSLFDLATGVRTAVRMGATEVSNSYGSRGELAYEKYFEPYYNYKDVAVVVSSGDYGYGNGLPLFGGPSYPGVSQYVTSVGGTSLTRADNERGWTESAWEGSTSGCSAYIHKPGWQKDTLCSMRMVSDVSAVADPRTGVAVYDTFGFDGWVVVGGTSASAPIIAGVYALAGDSADVRYGSEPYRHPEALYDVTSGANGTNCRDTYLCTGVPGYDGPTGLGSPRGTGAF